MGKQSKPGDGEREWDVFQGKPSNCSSECYLSEAKSYHAMEHKMSYLSNFLQKQVLKTRHQFEWCLVCLMCLNWNKFTTKC